MSNVTPSSISSCSIARLPLCAATRRGAVLYMIWDALVPSLLVRAVTMSAGARALRTAGRQLCRHAQRRGLCRGATLCLGGRPIPACVAVGSIVPAELVCELQIVDDHEENVVNEGPVAMLPRILYAHPPWLLTR